MVSSLLLILLYKLNQVSVIIRSTKLNNIYQHLHCSCCPLSIVLSILVSLSLSLPIHLLYTSLQLTILLHTPLLVTFVFDIRSQILVVFCREFVVNVYKSTD